ncbi:alkane 1-monooxygenase [Runella salmonicolor]|uniref:Alkane 1-monooxygenase n=1 Tax=Runella salmonicolor TaxID=2950278 RepID=A0ABT1FPA0_9BACT|nr:alkane 1-monooxygenase [Runella salmonicolor]MCP1383603.1 alkane 1-monooxygenase [Runella salmonicolor]
MSAFKKLGFLSIYLMILLSNGVFILTHGQFTWTGVLFAYGLVPLVDALMGKDKNNAGKEDMEQLMYDRFFDGVVFSLVYVHLIQLVLAVFAILTYEMTFFQWIGYVLSLGIFAGTMINVAHELGHRTSKTAQFHAKFTLMTVCYMHFFIEHNRGHHVWVATPHDPATARKGQSLYAFWWQSVTGSFRSALAIEKRLLKKANLPFWSVKNNMIWAVLCPLLFCGILTALGSWKVGRFAWEVIPFLWGQSLVAVLLLESVNYIEHYGIVRREMAPGKYERVNPLHSWNANHLFSNLVLFQLQRHSDHHAYASRPYQVLRHFDESPQLPFGYPLMILMASVPPLWFSVMDKRLEQWQGYAYDSQYIAQVVREMAESR